MDAGPTPATSTIFATFDMLFSKVAFSFLDLLFPKHCVSCGKLGSYLCKKCFSKVEFVDFPLCPICQRQAVEGKTHPGCFGKYKLDGLVVACRYKGAVKSAIVKVKYKWIYDIEQIFVDLLVARLWKFALPKNVVLVPVPLHQSRMRWRGFNQSEILAKRLSKKFKVPFCEYLIRNKETKTQVGLKREERKKNVKDAFSLKSGVNVQGKDLLLVDDVYTSGATMGECCSVLKHAGAKSVWALAVALG